MLSLKIPLKAMTLNQAEASARTGHRYKTDEYKAFKLQVNRYLRLNMAKMRAFAELYKPKEHGFIVRHYYYTPKDKMITKKGAINKKSIDADNAQKPLNDLIFKVLNRYNRSIDDAQMLNSSGIKQISSKSYMIIVEIEIISLEYFYRYQKF